MLNRNDHGLTICGQIISVQPPEYKSGTTEKGKSWAFHTQSIVLLVGTNVAELRTRQDNPITNPFTDNDLDKTIKVKVANPRSYNGKESFDIV